MQQLTKQDLTQTVNLIKTIVAERGLTRQEFATLLSSAQGACTKQELSIGLEHTKERLFAPLKDQAQTNRQIMQMLEQITKHIGQIEAKVDATRHDIQQTQVEAVHASSNANRILGYLLQ